MASILDSVPVHSINYIIQLCIPKDFVSIISCNRQMYKIGKCFIEEKMNESLIEVTEETHNYVVVFHQLPNGTKHGKFVETNQRWPTETTEGSYNRGKLHGICKGYGSLYSWHNRDRTELMLKKWTLWNNGIRKGVSYKCFNVPIWHTHCFQKSLTMYDDKGQKKAKIEYCQEYKKQKKWMYSIKFWPTKNNFLSKKVSYARWDLERPLVQQFCLEQPDLSERSIWYKLKCKCNLCQWTLKYEVAQVCPDNLLISWRRRVYNVAPSGRTLKLDTETDTEDPIYISVAHPKEKVDRPLGEEDDDTEYNWMQGYDENNVSYFLLLAMKEKSTIVGLRFETSRKFDAFFRPNILPYISPYMRDQWVTWRTNDDDEYYAFCISVEKDTFKRYTEEPDNLYVEDEEYDDD